MADAEHVVLAVSELGTNLVYHAGRGFMVLEEVTRQSGRRGVRVESRDAGPGISDVEAAMRDGYSTRGGYGNGLPAVRRLMDDLDIRTGAAGTTIVAYKWAAAS